MAFCLTEGMKQTTQKQVNLEKLGEISQGKEENPTLVLTRLSRVTTTHELDRLPGEVRSGPTLISWPAPGVRLELHRPEQGPPTPHPELPLGLALKV